MADDEPVGVPGIDTLGGTALRHRRVRLNGVRLHWVEAGDGPTIVLLHGFPDFWFGWRRQIPTLAAAGYRVVAPDLRGYNESERPRGWRHYGMETLAGDVEALLALLAEERGGEDAKPLLVGHDWGGVVAWRVGARRPEALSGLAILNSPHPAAYRREMRRAPQLLRSWYAIAVQLPRLPEAALRAFDHALLRKLWRAGAGPTGLGDAELAAYRSAFAGPGALEAALSYYRAAARTGRGDRPRGGSRVTLPTLVIWGLRDPALSPRLLQGLERWVPDLRLETLPRAGHWVHVDEPAAVNGLLMGFCRQLAQRGGVDGGVGDRRDGR